MLDEFTTVIFRVAAGSPRFTTFLAAETEEITQPDPACVGVLAGTVN
jgi:hypothetical protein